MIDPQEVLLEIRNGESTEKLCAWIKELKNNKSVPNFVKKLDAALGWASIYNNEEAANIILYEGGVDDTPSNFIVFHNFNSYHAPKGSKKFRSLISSRNPNNQ